MSLPLNGNQYFNRVENIASSQIQRIKSDNVQTTSLTVSSEFTRGVFRNVTVTGYAATQGTATWGASLTTVRGAAPSTATALVLPAGAIIKKIVVQGPVAGSGTLTLQTNTVVAPGGAAPTGTTTNYLVSGTVASINAGLEFISSQSTGTSPVGTQVYVNTVENSAALTVGSTLTVTITYGVIIA